MARSAWLVLFVLILARAAVGQCPTQALTPGAPSDLDFFGGAISVDGDEAFISSPRDDEPVPNAGSVSVFERIAGDWVETEVLRASDPVAYAYFGTSVCLAGDLAFVGARNAASGGDPGPGAVYVFERDGTGWQETAKLMPNVGTLGYLFGQSIAFDDGWLIVGAPHSGTGSGDSGPGGVHTFRKTPSGWAPGDLLTMPGQSTSADNFGYSVDVDGDTAVVGAWFGSAAGPSGAGAAFVYKRESASWELYEELLPAGLEYQDRFGFDVSIERDTILAAAYFDDQFGTNSGAVFVFDRIGSSWIETEKLVPEAPFSTYFGWAVDLDDDLAVIGAPGAGPDSPGRAYLFQRHADEWYSLGSMATGSSFGRSTVIAGDQIFVSSDDGPAGENSGTVHVYDVGGDTAQYCVGSPNSTGAGATIGSFGSTSIGCDNFTLWVSGAPPEQFGKFYYGPEAAQVPFGNGQACVGPGSIGVFRLLPAVPTDELGVFSRSLDFSSPPAGAGPGEILPGATWYFQYWYRDPGAGGAFFNLSDGLQVTFEP